jgi:hypothetical protein
MANGEWRMAKGLLHFVAAQKTTPRSLSVCGALVLLRHSDLALVELP